MRSCRCETCGKIASDGHFWDNDTLYKKCGECGTVREEWRKSISSGALIIDWCEEGDLHAVADLVKQGADVNALRICDGETALMRLCNSEKRTDRAKIADLLISAGANVHAQSLSGRTALHVAAFYGDTSLLSRLIAAGADVNARNGEGRTALAVAQQWCSSNQRETMALLIKSHAALTPVRRFEVFEMGLVAGGASRVPGVWLAENAGFDISRTETVVKQDDGSIRSGIQGRMDYLRAHYPGNLACIWRPITVNSVEYWLLVVY